MRKKARIIIDIPGWNWDQRELDNMTKEVALYAKALVPASARDISTTVKSEVRTHACMGTESDPCAICQMAAINVYQ
jgi:hypothetical protein